MAYIRTHSGREVDPATGGIRRRSAGWGGLGQFTHAMVTGQWAPQTTTEPAFLTDPTFTAKRFDPDAEAGDQNGFGDVQPPLPPPPIQPEPTLQTVPHAPTSPTTGATGPLGGPGGGVVYTIPWQGDIEPGAGELVAEGGGAGGSSDVSVTLQTPEQLEASEPGFGMVHAIMLAGVGYLLSRAYTDRKGGR